MFGRTKDHLLNLILPNFLTSQRRQMFPKEVMFSLNIDNTRGSLDIENVGKG
jgi:hypothetical protein